MKYFLNNKNKFLLIVLVALISCQIDNTYRNRERDRHDATVVTSLFYQYYKNGDSSKIYNLFSDVQGIQQRNSRLSKLFKVANQELGKIEKIHIDSISTIVSEGSKQFANYTVVYDVKHKIYNSKEHFFLMRENNKVKIIDFKIVPVKQQ